MEVYIKEKEDKIYSKQKMAAQMKNKSIIDKLTNK